MKPTWWSVLLVLCVAEPALAASETYVVTPGAPNEVVFESWAPLETIRGKSRALSGSLQLDPERLGDSVSVHFEVELATLSTRLLRRDKHMREDHLEVAKYPRATFDGVVLDGPRRLEPGAKATLEVEGTFAIHGTSRRLRLRAETRLIRDPSGERIEFRTTFPVSLAEYAIPRPQFLILKLADIQKVSVHGFANRRAPGELAGP